MWRLVPALHVCLATQTKLSKHGHAGICRHEGKDSHILHHCSRWQTAVNLTVCFSSRHEPLYQVNRRSQEALESATYSALGTETHLQSQLLPIFMDLHIGLLSAYWICFGEQLQSWRPQKCRVKPLTCHFIVRCSCIVECLHVISEILVKMR